MVLGRIGWVELVLILVLALIIIGPGKLPSVAKAVGKSIGEFRRGRKESEQEKEAEEPEKDD